MKIFDTQWRLGLERMYPLLEALGNPQEQLRIIQVAGTNGKGSISYLTAGIISQFTEGAVGLYTSPHLERLTERFCLVTQGVVQEINPELLQQTLDQVQEASLRLQPVLGQVTEFEAWTAAAACIFAKVGAEYAVFEVGLGGRLDATTALSAEMAVITPISFDHQDRLGTTLTSIAQEKAAIIRQNQPVVTSTQEADALVVIERAVQEKGAQLYQVTNRFQTLAYSSSGTTFVWYSSNLTPYQYQVKMLGWQQVENSAVALTVAEKLLGPQFFASESQDRVRAFLKSTCWPGRFEVRKVGGKEVLFDVGHNPQGLAGFLKNLNLYFGDRPILGVYGTLIDKDYKAAAALLESFPFRKLILTEPESERKISAINLEKVFTGKLEVIVEPNWQKAIEMALECTQDNTGLICVFGSFFLVGPVRGYLLSEGQN